ncbi:MAG TPA: hypothetical protein VE971_03815 [Candidatus Eisenbacteria bacterium]|nr:hypothetical protein [Candidatus Eisenbacteria bacterium]
MKTIQITCRMHGLERREEVIDVETFQSFEEMLLLASKDTILGIINERLVKNARAKWHNDMLQKVFKG